MEYSAYEWLPDEPDGFGELVIRMPLIEKFIIENSVQWQEFLKFLDEVHGQCERLTQKGNDTYERNQTETDA